MGTPNEVDRSERQERKMDKAEKQAENKPEGQQAAAQQAAAPKGAPAAPAGADFAAAVSEVQAKLAAMKAQPALAGPQISHGLAAAESQLQMALSEARSAQPQVERINAYLASAKKSLADLAGSAPMLGGLAASFDGLTETAKKSFGGTVSATGGKAQAE